MPPDQKPLFKTPFPGQAVVTKDPLKPDTRENFGMSEAQELEALRAEKAVLAQKIELPFLYGWNWYPWAFDFYNSVNKINLLCAANQISKSSTQIRKCINWATDQKLWPSLWRQRPTQFWYLYPTRAQVNQEFLTKWVPQFLPSGEMKNDPYYGWTVEKKGGDIIAIHFNSGVHVYFKTYSQDAGALQTGTCDAIFCDEELHVEIYEELMFRISAADGYFHMVFTATIGQDYWRRAMEPEEGEEEVLPEAFKQTVSLYDAMKYIDGSPSHWTLQKIKMIEARCSTHAEVLKRVFGRFIVIGGRKYESFDIKRHFKKAHAIPPGWMIFAGVDIGGGGEAHKSAIVFVAVSPDYRKGRAFLSWRGDSGNTTAGDVFQKYQSMVRDHKLNVTSKYYDWANKDFGEIAQRAGEPFERAEKSHEIGEDVVNTLFKNDMLIIYEDEAGENVKLVGELSSLKKNENKKKAKDDLADGLRYTVTKIPWDWTILTGAKVALSEDTPEKPLSEMQRQINQRRQEFTDAEQAEKDRIANEFSEWNEQYGN